VSQEGLVNVNIQGLEVFVPVSIAANVCDINVGVLAEQLREGGATCDTTAESPRHARPRPGRGRTLAQPLAHNSPSPGSSPPAAFPRDSPFA
jgi:hypothetical protein